MERTLIKCWIGSTNTSSEVSGIVVVKFTRQYIGERGHLQEIPHEAEVVENGINLGEMDAKLVQKIEELTLYMIDMNKRVNQLEQENFELKESNQELKEEVSHLKNKE